MVKPKTLLNRLFISWVWFVGAIGVIGFLVSSIITIHDSYLAGVEEQKSILEAKEQFKNIYPNLYPEFKSTEEIENELNSTKWRDPSKSELPEIKNPYINLEARIKLEDDPKGCYIAPDIWPNKELDLCQIILKLKASNIYVKFNEKYLVPKNSYPIFNRWGDSDFSHWTFLVVCSFWLFGAAFIIGVSFLLRMWIRFLFKEEPSEEIKEKSA